LACSGSAAAASDALGTSGAGSGNEDVAMDYSNDNDNDDDYEDDISNSNDDDIDDDETPGEADAPLEDKNLRRVHLLASVVRTNQDYGLGPMMPLPDASADALATFEDVEVQASTFFASRSLMCAGGFSEEDLPICLCCLR
jgi:hypothetical protein